MTDNIPGGYNGKILRVNLSNSKVSVEEIDELFCRKYLGGAGFVTYFQLKELEKGIDPLGPENKLIFAVGPLTGLTMPGSSRFCVGAKSPLTGGYAKSEAGGFWGAELKHAGFDAIIVEGKAEKPVYIWVKDGEASIRDASNLWGTLTKETEEAIRAELGDKLIRIASIGPGGENLVRIACIMNELKDANGRGGMGAVMGSKNLKAIAVRGHGRLHVVDPEPVRKLRQWVLDNRPLWASFNELGTGAAMETFVHTGNIPIRNFQDGEFPTISKISAEAVRDTIRVKMEACYGCPLSCKKVVQADEPYPIDPAYGGPEYETLAAIGSNCGVDDLAAVSWGNQLCNAYSLDSISTGDTIAFAMECFENGILTLEDTGGLDLRFGNAEAMIKSIELIAKREGIGNILAEGTARAAEQIGKGAEKYAMHVKGVEIPMHEPRVKAALGLGYIVNPHGADHCANLHDTMYSQPGPFFNRVKLLGILEPIPADDLSPKKVAMFNYEHLYRFVLDSLTICMFVPYNAKKIADVLGAVTGWETSTTELLRIAERTVTMARLINLREDLTAADDKLPDRFFQPKRDGVLATKHYSRDELEKAKSYYYTLMGWDAKTGVPTPEKLQELDIT